MIPTQQLMLASGGLNLLPMTLSYMGGASLGANGASGFDFGAEQDDRYIVAATAVTGLAPNFAGILINGAYATDLITTGVLSNMRASIGYMLVPFGTSGTVQVLGNISSHVYLYRVTGINPTTGPSVPFAASASYFFPGGTDRTPMHAATGPASIPANSCCIAVAAVNANAFGNPYIWGGINLLGNLGIQSSSALRQDAAATGVGAFTFDCAAAGSIIFAVGNLAGPS